MNTTLTQKKVVEIPKIVEAKPGMTVYFFYSDEKPRVKATIKSVDPMTDTLELSYGDGLTATVFACMIVDCE